MIRDNSKNISILLVDDHPAVRYALRRFLEGQEGMIVVGETGNGLEALEMCRKHRPDIVVLDLAILELDGSLVTREIVAKHPKSKVVVFSMHCEKAEINDLFEIGAMGYVAKDCKIEEVARAIRSVIEGNHYISSSVAVRMLDHKKGLSSEQPGKQELTKREQDVVSQIRQGRDTKMIADQLQLSPATVNTYRRRIMSKMKVTSVCELIANLCRQR